jgi:hypothetical protein
VTRKFSHDYFPVAADQFWIVRTEVGFAQSEIELGSMVGFIFGEEEPLGVIFVFSLETFLPPGLAIMRVKNRAAPKDSIPILHLFFLYSVKRTGVRDGPVKVYWQRSLRVRTNGGGVAPNRCGLLTLLLTVDPFSVFWRPFLENFRCGSTV